MSDFEPISDLAAKLRKLRIERDVAVNQHSKTSQRILSTPSTRTVASRQFSDQIIKEIKSISPDEKSGTEDQYRQLVDKVTALYFSYQQELSLQMADNATAYEKGNIGWLDYHDHRVTLALERRILGDAELELLNNKQRLLDEALEYTLIRKEHQEDMLKLLFTEFIENKWRSHYGKKTPRKVVGSTSKHIRWRDAIADEYGGICTRTGPSKLNHVYWCPILATWLLSAFVTAARIVPHCTRPGYVNLMFADSDHEGFLNSYRNGIIMNASLEDAFDRGDFVIVPNGEEDDSGKVELECRVIRSDFIGENKKMVAAWADAKGNHEIYFNDLHHRILVFPSECKRRPGLRSLFHHAVSAVMLAKMKQLPGWKQALDGFLSGPAQPWASPGPYLNECLLKDAWKYMFNENAPGGLSRTNGSRRVGGQWSPDQMRAATLQHAQAIEDRDTTAGEKED